MSNLAAIAANSSNVLQIGRCKLQRGLKVAGTAKYSGEYTYSTTVVALTIDLDVASQLEGHDTDTPIAVVLQGTTAFLVSPEDFTGGSKPTYPVPASTEYIWYPNNQPTLYLARSASDGVLSYEISALPSYGG